MDLVFGFANRISVLVSAALLVEGAPQKVACDPRVKAVYLGEAQISDGSGLDDRRCNAAN
jgi:branched-chain amino acid transport system ATP-binding protein